VTVTS